MERANPVTEKQDLPSDGIKKEKEEGLAPPLPPYPPLPQAPPLPSVDSGAPTPIPFLPILSRWTDPL